jgi:hypothetical protein
MTANHALTTERHKTQGWEKGWGGGGGIMDINGWGVSHDWCNKPKVENVDIHCETRLSLRLCICYDTMDVYRCKHNLVSCQYRVNLGQRPSWDALGMFINNQNWTHLGFHNLVMTKTSFSHHGN